MSSTPLLASPLLLLVLCGLSFTQTVKVLYSFDGTVGSTPWYVTLTQGRDGQLYGTTMFGGSGSRGTIFKIDTSGHAALLYSFSNSESEGGTPVTGLTLGTDGNFYGAASQGGSHGAGVVFKMTPSGSLTDLYSFDSLTGSFPYSPPIQGTDNNFYGTTTDGGNDESGVVYKLLSAGGFEVIYNCDVTHCETPIGAVLQGSDGKLYVTSNLGGGYGSVIQLSTAGVLDNTYAFNRTTTGAFLFDGVIQALDGNFYGTASGGGSNLDGVLFKLSSSFEYTALYEFGSTATDSIGPFGGIVQATDGNFYGTTISGGTSGAGTIYKYEPATGSFSIIYNWQAQTSSLEPQGSLMQHTNGKLYGVTYGGGKSGDGTIFSVDVGLAPFITLVQYFGAPGGTAQILGQGFTGATSVTFNGVAGSFKVVSDTFMTATIPAGATSGRVVVTTPSGTLTSNKGFRVKQ